MADSRYGGRYDRHSRSRSRSPFRKNFNERPNDRDRPRRRESSRERPVKNRVFVSNIPFDARWMELKDLFREKVGDVSFVELFDDDKGKFIGSGIVEFKDAEQAKKAVELMDKFEFHGRPLKVKLDNEPDRARSRALAMRGIERGERIRDGPGGYNDFRPPGHQFDTFGLNPEFLKSLGITGPLTPKIFISNLDYKVTEKKLEEIFKLAGKLVKMDLALDNEGKSKGHAIGEFEHPLEAVQAISMFSGQRLYARVMNVRMDRFADDEPSSKLPSGLHGIGKGLGMNGQPMNFTKSGLSNGGSFGMGVGGGMSGGGMGLGSSDMGMSSTPMGMSSGRTMGMSGMSDRGMMSSNTMGMGGMGASSMGASSLPMGMGNMGGNSSMMSSGNMSSSMDTMSRDGFPMSPSGPVGRGGGYREGFERGHDNYSSSSMSDTVMLGNLPSGFTWQMLKDRFRDIGDVRYAEMKGQGNAMIRFNSVQDAQRAVDMMNGVRFDGRPLQVRLY